MASSQTHYCPATWLAITTTEAAIHEDVFVEKNP